MFASRVDQQTPHENEEYNKKTHEAVEEQNKKKLEEAKEILRKIYHLGFSGGGAAGYGFRGAVEQLCELDPEFLSRITHVTGVSIGAVAALGCALNLNIEQMREKLEAIDFKQIPDTGSFPSLFYRMASSLTYCKGDYVYGQLLKLLQEATGRSDPENITFKDLEDMGFKSLYIPVTHYWEYPSGKTMAQTKVYSARDTPNAPVAAIVRASTAIPHYFPGVIVTEDEAGNIKVLPPRSKIPEGAAQLVDGAIACPLPSQIFKYKTFKPKEPKPTEETSKTIPAKTDSQPISYPSLEMQDFESPLLRIAPQERCEDPHMLTLALQPRELATEKGLRSRKPVHRPGLINEGKSLVTTMMRASTEALMRDDTNKQIIVIPHEVEIHHFNAGVEKQEKAIYLAKRAVLRHYSLPTDGLIKPSPARMGARL